MSVYTPTYPFTLAKLLMYRKEFSDASTAPYANPSIQQTNQFTFFESCIGSAYSELEKLLNQPILQRSYVYQYTDEETAEIGSAWYYRKHILPLHTVPLVTPTLEYRLDPYSSFLSVDSTLFKVDSNKTGWHLYHRVIGETYKLSAGIGYTEAAMPNDIYMAAVELAQGAILRSPYGDSRLGKESQQASGQGAGYSTSYSDISEAVLKRIEIYKAGVL